VNLGSKLQLKSGQKLESVHVPQPAPSALTELDSDNDDLEGAALLVFVADRAALEDHRMHIVEAASADRLTWVSYPKSGQLGTDLNCSERLGRERRAARSSDCH
jgi:hypothetical protein